MSVGPINVPLQEEMTNKSKKHKSKPKKPKESTLDWMFERWCEANGLLDDPKEGDAEIAAQEMVMQEEQDDDENTNEWDDDLENQKAVEAKQRLVRCKHGVSTNQPCSGCDEARSAELEYEYGLEGPEEVDAMREEEAWAGAGVNNYGRGPERGSNDSLDWNRSHANENSTWKECPECQSPDIRPERSRGSAYGRICSNCGYYWTETPRDAKPEESGQSYAGTCDRCRSDNTKKTKSKTGTTIGLCNDCGNTWKLKEAPTMGGGQKGGEIPIGETLGEEKQEPKECFTCGHPLDREGHCSWCAEMDSDEPREEEPDPSNPNRELDADPDLGEPLDKGGNVGSDTDGMDEPTKMKPQTYSAEGVDLPDKIEIPERLYNDLMMMIEYSVTNDNEAGGFLIVAEHGNIGVVGEQFGKDREIVLEPNEALHEGESLIGTVHMHPVTPTASTGDVKGYLNDENEKVMVVVGADKSINFFFKVPGMTKEGDYGDEISENFEQEDMGLMCEGFGFIWYRGEESDRTELHLMGNVIEDIEFNVVDEAKPVEEVIQALGIEGVDEIPAAYSTKKVPVRLEIAFKYCGDAKTLKG